MAKIDLKYCSIRIQDGTAPANFIEVKVGDGTLTWSEKRNMEYQLDRGNLDTVREGDQVPMDISLDLMYEFIKSDSTGVPTPEEALKKIGEAAAWTSTSSDACEPYAVDLILIYTPPCGGEKIEAVILPDYRWESLDHDPKAGTIVTSGKCNATQALIQRLSATSSLSA